MNFKIRSTERECAAPLKEVFRGNGETEIGELKRKQIEIFSKDLSYPIAKNFVDGLYRAASASNGGSLLEEGYGIFYKLARETYGPLMCSYTDWLLKGYSQAEKGGKIVFVARDSVFAYTIAKTMLALDPERYEGLTQSDLNLVYFTRKLAGESDEIAKIGKKSVDQQLVSRYLKQEGVDRDALLVDMGMYGTLYNKGCQLYWDSKPAIVFFYSKNPNILGFLNMVHGNYDETGCCSDRMSAANKYLANVIVDSMESVNPQQHLSPGRLMLGKDGRLRPVLEPVQDACIQSWARGTLAGYVTAAIDHAAKPAKIDLELSRLGALSQQAKSGWTGVLPEITPEWSLKEAFLDNRIGYEQKTGCNGYTAGKAPPLGTKDFAAFRSALASL